MGCSERMSGFSRRASAYMMPLPAPCVAGLPVRGRGLRIEGNRAYAPEGRSHRGGRRFSRGYSARCRCLYCGRGPVGASLACRLGRAGLRVAVLDRAALAGMEHPDLDGRAYAIAAGPKAFLEEAGVWDALPRPSCPIEDILVTDGRPGEPASSLFLEFKREDAGQPFGWMIEARALRVALNACLAATPGIKVLAPVEASITRRTDGARISLSDGLAPIHL